MVVPKRAAMLLDRLMVALHHALERGEGEDGGGRPINKVYRDAKYGGRPVTNGMVKQHGQQQQQQQPSKTEQLMKSYYAGKLSMLMFMSLNGGQYPLEPKFD